jgi:hypothetical protein
LSKKIKSKKILFLIRLVLFFAFFYLLWYHLSPFYNQVLALVSEEILQISESSELKITKDVIAVGKQLQVYLIPEGSPVVELEGNLVHFDMVLLFALIWAVPQVSIKKRMKIFLLGFLIIFGLHWFKIFVFFKQYYSDHIQLDGVSYWSPFQRKVYLYLSTFIFGIMNQIFPVIIWSLLYVPYWWNDRRRSSADRRKKLSTD